MLDRAVTERVAAGATVVYVDHDPRRLADAVDAAYRVEGLGLTAAPLATGLEPRVRIEATAPSGTPLPAGLPGAPAYTLSDDGTARLTVPAAHSDALLGALLSARPPWHIGAVEQVRGPDAGRTVAGGGGDEAHAGRTRPRLEPAPHRSPTPDGNPAP